MRVRQHVNPLQSFFLRIPIERLELPDGVPVEVELGSAEALFLFERAQEDPGRCYVGVELRRGRVELANQDALARGLGGRVCSVFANMTVDLPRLLPPARVSRFFLNFPDPWFKSRQHKRRVMSPGLVDDLVRLLEPGGEIHVASDIFELALDAMAALETAGLANKLAPWSFPPSSPFAARSRRERQCEAEGVRIWRLVYATR